MERDFIPGLVETGKGAMVLHRKTVGLIWHKEGIFYGESGETLEQVAQGSCGCPIKVRLDGALSNPI